MSQNSFNDDHQDIQTDSNQAGNYFERDDYNHDSVREEVGFRSQSPTFSNHEDAPLPPYHDQRPRPRGPPRAPPDMPGGCESVACHLARTFYTRHHLIIRRMKTRAEFAQLYIATFPQWAPPDILRNTDKHRPISQIIFSLVHNGRVLRIHNGNNLQWL